MPLLDILSFGFPVFSDAAAILAIICLTDKGPFLLGVFGLGPLRDAGLRAGDFGFGLEPVGPDFGPNTPIGVPVPGLPPGPDVSSPFPLTLYLIRNPSDDLFIFEFKFRYN